MEAVYAQTLGGSVPPGVATALASEYAALSALLTAELGRTVSVSAGAGAKNRHRGWADSRASGRDGGAAGGADPALRSIPDSRDDSAATGRRAAEPPNPPGRHYSSSGASVTAEGEDAKVAGSNAAVAPPQVHGPESQDRRAGGAASTGRADGQLGGARAFRAE